MARRQRWEPSSAEKYRRDLHRVVRRGISTGALKGKGGRAEKWCCQTGLNCRPLHYQWSALPLSYGSMRFGHWIERIGRKRPYKAGRSLPQGQEARKRGKGPLSAGIAAIGAHNGLNG